MSSHTFNVNIVYAFFVVIAVVSSHDDGAPLSFKMSNVSLVSFEKKLANEQRRLWTAKINNSKILNWFWMSVKINNQLKWFFRQMYNLKIDSVKVVYKFYSSEKCIAEKSEIPWCIYVVISIWLDMLFEEARVCCFNKKGSVFIWTRKNFKANLHML